MASPGPFKDEQKNTEVLYDINDYGMDRLARDTRDSRRRAGNRPDARGLIQGEGGGRYGQTFPYPILATLSPLPRLRVRTSECVAPRFFTR